MINTVNKAVAARRDSLKNDDKGFTLIELLVVVLIIGVLAAIAIPAFLSQQAGARDSAVQADIGNAKTALIAELVTLPTGGTFPTIADLTEFTPDPDSGLVLSGDASAFCIQGKSAGNGAGATTFGASDISGTVAGTCAAGVLTPATP